MSENILKFALPKGSLQESTFALMKKAGFDTTCSSRSYIPSIDDDELTSMLFRAQEIARYVELGVMDIGLTGHDWVLENNSDVEILEELVYSKQRLTPVRWVLCVPEESDIQSVKDLQGKRIATELVGATKRWLEKNDVQAEVEFSWGATEVKARGLVDAIVEVTETGSSLRANRLRIVETLMTSCSVLIMNKEAYADPWKRKKAETIAMLLKGAISAREKVLLKLNVPADKLDAICEQLPSLHKPTVSQLADKSWFALETVVSETVVRTLIPTLKEEGATGIIEVPLNKIID